MVKISVFWLAYFIVETSLAIVIDPGREPEFDIVACVNEEF